MSAVSGLSLSSLLPAPQPVNDREARENVVKAKQEIQLSSKTAPPYGHRKNWVPRTQEDYGDGGAYPEISVAQYPLGMGQKKSTSNALTLAVDKSGKLKFDSLAKQGHGKDKVVFSKYTDLLPKTIDNDDPEMDRPDEEEVEDTTEKTRQALERLTQAKISAAMPVRAAEKQAPAQYIRYTPSQQGVTFNSGAKQRIIRMVEAQVDPMEPPKFKINKKIPRGPPSPPAPVMHSPNRKVTVKEQQEWKIPPSLSNWKNAKGYTVPLDKRLAADGRGLQSTHISENFAKLADALYIADRKAREAVEIRAKVQKKMVIKKKTETEEQLRKLAQKAREERAGMRRGAAHEDDEEAAQRDEIRRERQKERQRDRNLARAAPDKRNRLQKERERDVSEKIALGLPNTGVGSHQGEVQFDQRLYNQSKGMDSGFGDDEAYNVYDKAWRSDKEIGSHIYRPSKNVDRDNYGDDLDKIASSKRFVPDRGFEGTDRNRSRDGPVAFESDPFDIDQFFQEAKEGRKRPADDRGKDYDRKKRRE